MCIGNLARTNTILLNDMSYLSFTLFCEDWERTDPTEAL
jgi:hypothetical protein